MDFVARGPARVWSRRHGQGCELRRKPVGDLTPEDLGMLIGQQVGVDVLLHRTLKLLKYNPLPEGDFMQAVCWPRYFGYRNRPGRSIQVG
jgi:hypothetical protein